MWLDILSALLIVLGFTMLAFGIACALDFKVIPAKSEKSQNQDDGLQIAGTISVGIACFGGAIIGIGSVLYLVF